MKNAKNDAPAFFPPLKKTKRICFSTYFKFIQYDKHVIYSLVSNCCEYLISVVLAFVCIKNKRRGRKVYNKHVDCFSGTFLALKKHKIFQNILFCKRGSIE